MLYCPECETSLDVEEDEVDEGEVLSCPECGSDFEVSTINPVELKPVDEEEEYEEDDEEDEPGDTVRMENAKFSGRQQSVARRAPRATTPSPEGPKTASFEAKPGRRPTMSRLFSRPR